MCHVLGHSDVLQTYNALIVDSLIMFAKALTELKKQTSFNLESVDCDDDDSKWKAGFQLRARLKAVSNLHTYHGSERYLQCG